MNHEQLGEERQFNPSFSPQQQPQYHPSQYNGGGGHQQAQYYGNGHLDQGGGGGGMGNQCGDHQYQQYQQQGQYYSDAFMAAEQDWAQIENERNKRGSSSQEVDSQYAKTTRLISHEHDAVVTKTLHLTWQGKSSDFAKGGEHIKWQAHPNTKLDPTNRLIAVETKLVSVKNDGPHNIGVKLHGTPVNVEAIGNNAVNFDFIACGHTIQPQTYTNKILYLRTKSNGGGVDIETLAGWSKETEDSIRQSVIDRLVKGGRLWKLQHNSPVLHVALNNEEKWGYLKNAMSGNPSGIFLNADIAAECEQFAINVVKNLPFQSINNISATIHRADGLSFDDMTGVTDGSAISAFKEQNAKGGLINISAEVEMKFIVWRSDVNELYDTAGENNEEYEGQ